MVAASLAASFAMAASFVKFFPVSLSIAALQVRRRAESRASAIFANICCTICSLAMGLPKALRSTAYLAAQSMAADAIPRAWPAMPMRPASRVVMATLKPWPSAPRRFEAGMTTSSMMRFPVLLARMPSLSSFAPKLNPGASVGTKNAEIPLCFRDLSVVAKTMAVEASWAFVIQAFVPFSVYESPVFTAVVEAAPASLPFPGSLKPKHPIFSPVA
mmetsp:Transcript_8249/g.15020  ORF Transcript_8249/g.15020 Transcript_8249/m.15020 type:complete len:216 (-) Transcript_8249:456-1103(-)